MDGAGNGRPAKEGHDGAETNVTVALAFAGALAGGTAESCQEAAADIGGRVGQLTGALARLGAGNVRRATGNSEHGIEESFRGQPAREGMRVVHGVILVPLGRANRELIDARLADKLDQVPRIEVMVDELAREIFEQGRIAGRVAGANIVERLDDAGAGEIAPKTIGIARGEETVLGRADPGRKLLAPAGLLLYLALGRKRKNRRRYFAGAVVLDFAFGGVGYSFVKRLGILDRAAADLFTFALGVFLQGHLGEISGQMIVLILGPALEGMIVAFVAIEPRGEEKMGRILHRLRGRAENLPITGRRILASRACRGQNFASKLIVGRVLLDLVANPRAEQVGAFGPQELAIALEEIGPFIGPKINVLRAAN